MHAAEYLYHLCLNDDWAMAKTTEGYYGSQKEKTDGFIHMSKDDQVKRSAARYYEKNPNLTLLQVDPKKVIGEIKWEPSSRGELYAHLYGYVPHAAIVTAIPLPLDSEGKHVFPEFG